MEDSSSEDSYYSAPERAAPPSKMTPEIEAMLSQATGFYLMGQFEQASELLTNIITRAPSIPDPHLVLGKIKQELGEKERAAHFYFLYAQLKKDVGSWVKAAEMYKDLGQWKEAAYCFERALKNSHGFEPHIMKEK